jgi:hypothetical protein
MNVKAVVVVDVVVVVVVVEIAEMPPRLYFWLADML